MKVLILNRGYQCSLHYHPVKAESFLCIEGEVEIELDSVTYVLTPGTSIDIPPGHPHRFSARTPTATVVEASTHHSDEDVVRLEDSRQVNA